MPDQDKINHFVVGQVAFLAAFLLSGPVFGLFASSFIGIGKEVWDYISRKGTPEYMDAAATILGGLVLFYLTIWNA